MRVVLPRQRRDYGIGEDFPATYPVDDQAPNVGDTPVNNLAMERLVEPLTTAWINCTPFTMLADSDLEMEETDYLLDNINSHSSQENLPEIIEGDLLVLKVGGKHVLLELILLKQIVTEICTRVYS